jgi:hypothetical protein
MSDLRVLSADWIWWKPEMGWVTSVGLGKLGLPSEKEAR